MPAEQTAPPAGLCANCRFARVIRSDRGAVFYQCAKSFEDPRFPKYPPLPMWACPGYKPKAVAEE
jgi:hypothetical protein